MLSRILIRIHRGQLGEEVAGRLEQPLANVLHGRDVNQFDLTDFREHLVRGGLGERHVRDGRLLGAAGFPALDESHDREDGHDRSDRQGPGGQDGHPAEPGTPAQLVVPRGGDLRQGVVAQAHEPVLGLATDLERVDLEEPLADRAMRGLCRTQTARTNALKTSSTGIRAVERLPSGCRR